MLKLIAVILGSYVGDVGPAGYVFVPGAGLSMTVKLDGRTIEPGKVYLTGPLTAPKTVAFDVTWESGTGRRHERVAVTLTPGYVTTVRLALPVEWAGVIRPPNVGQEGDEPGERLKFPAWAGNCL